MIEQVVAAMNSSVSINRNFWIDSKTGNQYFVGVQYAEDPYATKEKLENVFVTGSKQEGNEPVAARALLPTIRDSTGAVEINHSNLYRVYNVLVNTENRDVGGVAADLENRLKSVKVPEGMRVKLKGEYGRMVKTFQYLAFGLGLAIILVYFLQVALFRSWIGPFIIMFTVPLGLIGVLTMLFLTHTTLNVQSLMGTIFLVGIEVNTGVLMVEFANKQRRLGLPVEQAIRMAAGIRFRPIMMTFLATFFDLLPLAIGLERGSEATVPLARAVVGGLLVSTALSLLILPILYTMLVKEEDVVKREAAMEAELADRPIALANESANVGDFWQSEV